MYTAVPSTVTSESVIAYLHNHQAIIGLSPLVTSSKRAATQRSGIQDEYNVHEEISVLPMGLYRKTISFKAIFEDRDTGVWSKVFAPLGFVSEALYTVERITAELAADVVDDIGARIESEWVLKETITSSCNIIFKAFVDASLVPTRRTMAQKLMAKLQNGNKLSGN